MSVLRNMPFSVPYKLAAAERIPVVRYGGNLVWPAANGVPIPE